MILRLRACYCLVSLAAGKPWRLYFQRYHIGILAVNPNVYIFPLKPCIHLFNLFFFFPLQSRLLPEPSPSPMRRPTPWGWRGNGRLAAWSTTASLTDPRPEDGSWLPRWQLARPPPCWETWPPSPPTRSQCCQSTALERAKPGKEKEQHVRWSPTQLKRSFSQIPDPRPPWMTSHLMSLAKVPVWPWKISNLSFLVAFFSFIVTPYKSPRNLQTSEPSKTSFRVTWDAAPGDVRGYKVIFHPVDDEINLSELTVGPYDNTVVLEELRCVFRVCRLSQLILNDSTRTPCLKYPLLSWCAELEPNTQWMCLVCLMEERVCHWPEKSIPPSLMNQTPLFIIQVRKIVFYPFITYIQSEFYTYF